MGTTLKLLWFVASSSTYGDALDRNLQDRFSTCRNRQQACPLSAVSYSQTLDNLQNLPSQWLISWRLSATHDQQKSPPPRVLTVSGSSGYLHLQALRIPRSVYRLAETQRFVNSKTGG